MEEVIVHVTTLEQWKSVLDTWFNQGYTWPFGDKEYSENMFEDGGRFLFLDDEITFGEFSPEPKPFIEYSEFMEQHKGDKAMPIVYEVSQSVFDELQRIKAHEGTSLIGAITLNEKLITSIKVGNRAILRYLAGDPAVEFKTKAKLYRLWGTDCDGDKGYFAGGNIYSPTTLYKKFAFTAPLDEIKKWETPDWHIEEAD